MRSQSNDGAVDLSDASVVFEVLKEGAAAELDGGAICWCDPHPSSAEPDGKLLAGKVFHALEFVLVEVAFPFRYRELVTRFETEGARGLGHR